MTLSTLPMTTSYMARPHAATADRRPQGRRATNLMNVRSSCLSELFREHPLLQRARAVHCTATSGCDRGSSLCHPETLPVGTKAVPCTAHTASLARIGGTAGTPITEPHLAHSSRHNNRLLSHRSSDPQKCRTGYSRWFPPPPLTVPTLTPVICREIPALRATTPSRVPGRAVLRSGTAGARAGQGHCQGHSPMATGQR